MTVYCKEILNYGNIVSSGLMDFIVSRCLLIAGRKILKITGMKVQ